MMTVSYLIVLPLEAIGQRVYILQLGTGQQVSYHFEIDCLRSTNLTPAKEASNDSVLYPQSKSSK